MRQELIPYQDPGSGWTALHYAALQGDYLSQTLAPIRSVRQAACVVLGDGARFHLTQNIFEVVLQKSTPPKIRQLIPIEGEFDVCKMTLKTLCV